MDDDSFFDDSLSGSLCSASNSLNIKKFFNDIESGISGVVRGGTEIPKNSFALKLLCLVEAEGNTGYLAEVRRELDKAKRICFFTSESVNIKSKFLAQINMSFGSGGMTSSLENNQLTEYFQFIQRAHDGPIPIKKAVLIPGRQSPSGLWVLNSQTYVKGDGRMIDDTESTDLVWIDKDVLYESDKIRSADITPPICHPLSEEPLQKLVSTCEMISKHNFIPTLLVIGGCIAAFHFDILVEKNSSCPIVVAIGESETGKSTAIRLGLSLFGCDEIARYVKGTNAAFLERASRSSIPFAIEEAKGSKKKSTSNNLDLSELVITLSNGSRCANMKSGSLKPKTVPVISSNYDMEDIERVKSRVLVVPFSLPPTGPVTTEEYEAFKIFEDNLLCHKYSSCVGWVIKQRDVFIKEGKAFIEIMQDRLSDSLQWRVRNSNGWAVCIFFVKQLLAHAGKEATLDEVVSFVVSSVEAENQKGNRSVQPSELSKSPKENVQLYCQQLANVARNLQLSERLQFIRTQTEVDGEEVLAVYTKKACEHMASVSPAAFTLAIRKSGIGKTQVKRQFLKEGSGSVVVKLKQGSSNSINRSCCAIFLKDLPADICSDLKHLTRCETKQSEGTECRENEQSEEPETECGETQWEQPTKWSEGTECRENKQSEEPETECGETQWEQPTKRSEGTECRENEQSEEPETECGEWEQPTKESEDTECRENEQSEETEWSEEIEHQNTKSDSPDTINKEKRKRKRRGNQISSKKLKISPSLESVYCTRSKTSVPRFSKTLCHGDSLF